MGNIGLLAFGSLILEPGVEIQPLLDRRIPAQTPFPVEYARFSNTRGDAPTLVPHEAGSSVTSEVLVLKSGVSLDQAKDLLWRRETRNEGTGKRYPSGSSPKAVIIGHLENFQGIAHVLYTDFQAAGKIKHPDLAELIRKSITSVQKADIGKDGLSYLLQALKCGIRTPLTDPYIQGVLEATGADSLQSALGWLQAERLAGQAKSVLRVKAGRATDSDGYVEWPQDNLLPGVRLEQFEADLRRGAGAELRIKFCAVHSSCALAVNTFGPFKDRPRDLVLLGQSGFDPPSFEQELPTHLQGTPPTLDVFLRRGSEAVAVESKFLEYLIPKRADFSASYNRAALPWAEDCWWQVLENSKKARKRHLDVAQLVKHYLGIGRLLSDGDRTGWKPTNVQLLYLFWEPENPEHIQACMQHQREIQELASAVAGSKVPFRWQSYPELWREWSEVPALVDHARNLASRYSAKLS
jgi:hypothetical protein